MQKLCRRDRIQLVPIISKVGGDASHGVRRVIVNSTVFSIANERVPKIAINYTINIFLKTAIIILVISNHNRFRVLFDKNASVYFTRKTYLYFSVGNGQPTEPALCRLYWHTSFVPHSHGYLIGQFLRLRFVVAFRIIYSFRVAPLG